MKKILSIDVEQKAQRIDSIISRLHDNYKKKTKNVFLSTGFENIDKHVGGFEMGTNIVIGARPSVGKTALALDLAMKIIENNQDINIVVLYYNWEMSNDQIGYRYLSTVLQKNILDVKKTDLDLFDESILENYLEKISNYNIFFLENNNRLQDFYNYSVNFKRSYPDFYLINIIDHTRLVSNDSSGTEEQKLFALYQKANEVKKLGCINILLSQLNRDYEKGLRNTYRDPSNTDLFGADAAQQFADVTMLLHAPKNYGTDEWEILTSKNSFVNVNTTDKLYLQISKNRNGMINYNLCLKYNKEFQTFDAVL
jgi:replicative DNA helicase